ncbi:ABC transporter substrate-binding protein [Aureimonas sp. SA4125]|nr:ABC transporter substrate-binding protein [Aureimonas sp. SA4125]
MAASFFLGSPLPAHAHPHVFVSATMTVSATPEGDLLAVHNSWWMDELFSSSVVVDFDENANGRLDPEELSAVGKQVGTSIKEWSYYTFVRQGAGDVALAAPAALDVVFDAKRGQLQFSFQMKPEKPLRLKGQTTTFSNFDDTYFVAFDFAETGAFVTKDLPSGCKSGESAPSPDEAAKSWMATIAGLGPGDTVPEDGIKFSEVLSTKFTLDCSKD